MNIAYADSSVFAALAFRERTSANLRRRLRTFDRVVTSVFTEAELASACAREGVTLAISPLQHALLLGAADPLTQEVQTVLAAGHLRGADCWHLAVALNYSPDRDLTFLSLDAAQRDVAATLGFRT